MEFAKTLLGADHLYASDLLSNIAMMTTRFLYTR